MKFDNELENFDNEESIKVVRNSLFSIMYVCTFAI